ncbi:hypothetical protein BDV06DRAFT_228813 [Aspergillus oleicola]
MKLSLSILLPLFIATGMAAPLPEMDKPAPRQLQGGTLPEALSSADGLGGLLGQVKLPIIGGGGSRK